jgi:glutaredoxin
MRSLDVDFQEYNIEKDSARRDEMRKKTGGSMGVPVIDIDGTIIRGYNPDAIKAALDRAAR